MFSTLSQRAARETLEALSRGANDYVTKPANVGSAALAMQRVREELIPKIKSLCPSQGSLSPVSSVTPQKMQMLTSPPVAKGISKRVDVLAIGVSTGGPNALAEVLPLLPKDFPVPIVIVQHMPPVFTKCLGERLSTKCQITVQEGVAGTILGTRASLDCTRGLSYDCGKKRDSFGTCHESGPPGEFLSSGSRCVVSLGCASLWRSDLSCHSDRYGGKMVFGAVNSFVKKVGR